MSLIVGLIGMIIIFSIISPMFLTPQNLRDIVEQAVIFWTDGCGYDLCYHHQRDWPFGRFHCSAHRGISIPHAGRWDEHCAGDHHHADHWYCLRIHQWVFSGQDDTSAVYRHHGHHVFIPWYCLCHHRRVSHFRHSHRIQKPSIRRDHTGFGNSGFHCHPHLFCHYCGADFEKDQVWKLRICSGRQPGGSQTFGHTHRVEQDQGVYGDVPSAPPWRPSCSSASWGQASPSGRRYELDAIAAAAIGGTSMAGGRGTILGTFIGAILFSALKNRPHCIWRGLLLAVHCHWSGRHRGSICGSCTI